MLIYCQDQTIQCYIQCVMLRQFCRGWQISSTGHEYESRKGPPSLAVWNYWRTTMWHQVHPTTPHWKFFFFCIFSLNLTSPTTCPLELLLGPWLTISWPSDTITWPSGWGQTCTSLPTKTRQKCMTLWLSNLTWWPLCKTKHCVVRSQHNTLLGVVVLFYNT